MVEDSLDLWKLIAIAMALVMATALVGGLVMANWSGVDTTLRLPAAGSRAGAMPDTLTRPVAQTTAVPATVGPGEARPTAPPAAAVEDCNAYAARQAPSPDTSVEVVKDAAIAAVVGVAGLGTGTLYGLREDRKADRRYRDAYGACMRSWGYAAAD